MNSKSYNSMLLIVDNNPTRLELVVEAIKACGCRVFIAQSGKEALAYANQIHPDLILLNAILSGEDGFDICRCFKANTQTCDIPIICMVPEATIEYKAKCFATGCVDYIVNPLYLEEVSFRVTTHLELAAARRELRARNSQPQNQGLAFNTDKRQLHSQVGLLSDAKALLALKRFALARIHEAAFLIDETGQLHYVNQAVCNRLGYTQEELLGLNLRVIDPSWMKGFQANDWEKHWAEMRKEGGMTFETRHLTRSGEVFPVEVTANYFEYGNNAYLLGLARDITERKRAEAELRQYREHLEQLVSKRTVALNRALEFTEGVINAIPDLLFELDKEGRHLNVWTCFPELLVSLREDMLGKTVAEVLSPEATTTVMEALAEASTTSMSFGKRILIDLPTGPSWFELSVSSCPGGSTGDPHFLVLSRDISERIRAEEEICRLNIELKQRVRCRTAQLEVANNELRISELEYRSLVENLPDNVIRYNAACQTVYCNPNSLRVLGRSIEDVLGKTPTETFPDIDNTKTYQAAMQRVIATGQPEQVEIEVFSLDGDKQTHQVSLVAERGLDGRILGALAIGRDVTKQVMTERRLEKSHASLRELLARREADLDHERRHIAREMHDELGQLLTALKLGISTLKMQFGAGLPAFETKADGLLELANQAIRTVRSVSTSLRPTALDMGIIPALQWLVDEFQQHSGVACQLKTPDTLYGIDELRAMTLFRTVQEALTSATRHAEASRVEIDLNKQTDGSYSLTIRDNGKGFDPTTATTHHFGLIGMRERISSLGGTLVIDSTPGAGTCIRMCIPELNLHLHAYP